ncbi:MAG: tRNA (5-methylaminomethyl-2-thiouridine)(34)-methyltransferase MnmD [Phenylobacterium sp.]|uniref:tRNA (5-methylaminomethyl-2-thiouridine)(34)-methyltransferase MnmD n=1 Tax=Phenylobacterium sp. TaxID=1871053 RepID=UPI001A48A150|nr:tRNA (5-methylaminomethyl-2-thiouridine)(34)-methyltransferase MnmD [Phenylobacterium sp.]MBL8556359.1 tRNA (5-methylaminomethyl-2-thiouridine)(34)-methyltransferase MnmD [Phenylobacterium sp.]
MSADSPLEWTPDGQPRSRAFGDVYFSAEDGLAETRAVFLAGCGLPQAWAGRRRFVVGELGFGTGLNIAALLQLWAATRPPHGRLHVFSIEAFPIAAHEAARALSRWPELAEVVGLLTSHWPGRARGRHRVDLPELSATLDLAAMEAEPALAGWQGRADAWFLDGFAPSANPQMWSDEVLGLVAARSAPGARAATFTVAGQVRRGLAAHGFAVAKRPGFGRKRERLEAWLAGEAADPPTSRVAIVGAGIAGAAAARAVRALGGEAAVVEAAAPGSGGSGNPAALVTPRLDAGLGEAARLFAQAFGRATMLYAGVAGATIVRGVLQLASDAREAERFAKIAASDVFEAGDLAVIDPAAAAARLGELAPAALDQASALAIDPAPVLAAWAGAPIRARVAALTRDGGGWRLLDTEGREILRADAVILAAALASRELAPDLPLQAVRGQATFASGPSAPAAAWGGYVLPTRDGLLFGATHDRDDAGADLRPDDHRRNLDTLARALPGLAARVADLPLAGRASVRAVTPDRAPIAGALGGGLFALTGFGSRGFSLAPLLAEHVAALALGAPSPIGAAAADLVDPGRFARRAARRGS